MKAFKILVQSGFIITILSCSAFGNEICELILNDDKQSTVIERNDVYHDIYRKYFFRDLKTKESFLVDTRKPLANNQMGKRLEVSATFSTEAVKHGSDEVLLQIKKVSLYSRYTGNGSSSQIILNGLNPLSIRDVQLSQDTEYLSLTHDALIEVWKLSDLKFSDGKAHITPAKAYARFHPFRVESQVIRTEFMSNTQLLVLSKDGKLDILDIAGAPANRLDFGEELIFSAYKPSTQFLGVIAASGKTRFFSINKLLQQ